MSINPQGAASITLNVLGSWVTEMSSESVPSGCSPDNQDMIFAPGQTGGRGALDKIFNTPFPGNPTCVAGKSFVLPDKTIKNLYWNSDGTLYVEDVTNSPGTYTLLLTSTPNCYFKSITAFGREYIAISDGLHGQEIPLQYDGVNLDRVTQDGPGAPPTVTNVAYPAVALSAVASGSYTVSTVDATDFDSGSGLYNTLTIETTSPSGFSIGDNIVLAGVSDPRANQAWTVSDVLNSLVFQVAYFDVYAFSATGGTAALASAGPAVILTRAGNIVSGSTATPHNLQIGYQALIAGVKASEVGGGITSIIINNEDNPGLATITTASPHGLVPQNIVNIQGVPNTLIGGGITHGRQNDNYITFTTATPHGLNIGSFITISGTGPDSPPIGDGQWNVFAIPSPTQFTINLPNATGFSDNPTFGNVEYIWPSATTGNPDENQFTVVESPSATTFTVEILYSNGNWAGGTVSFAWDGLFFVSSVPTDSSFTYKQYGPNSTATGPGTVKPNGQIAPGQHQMRVSYLTRQGYLTRPSPWVLFTANGGQYISVTNIPIGPSNTVARVIQFTGAQGAYFFYIPIPATIEGQVVSTATQINDNTTTTVLLDFSDNTLFASLGVSIPGNNLASQIILDGALGFAYYDSRLITNGQRNMVQNFLNMGFDGGYLPSDPNQPTGWQNFASNRGELVNSGQATAWQIPITGAGGFGELQQPAYEDAYSAPIITGNTLYRVRVKIVSSTVGLEFPVSLIGTGFATTVNFMVTDPAKLDGAYYELVFPDKTPTSVPTDLRLHIEGMSSDGGTTTGTLVVDELEIIYDETPYLDTILYGSYVDNAEGFDGLSGKFGPVDDTRKVMDYGIVRSNFYMLTQEPSGRLHQTSPNGVTEPSGWSINEVASNCGALSAFSVTKSQADDSSAAGGEEWIAWASESGARIFSGDNPYKISQEIQPNWFDAESGPEKQINMAAALSIFAINDPIQRVMYFGLPIGTATAPSLIYPLNYRELDSAYSIANSPPYHPSLAGRLVATDNTRKWTRWNMTMNGMSRMYRDTHELTMIFFGGNGQALGDAPGFGNIYDLNPLKYTDDDYGQINPYYVTYFAPSSDEAQALQLDAGRKMLAYLTAFVSTVGNVTLTILCDRLDNPWPLTCTRNPGLTPKFDAEFGGGYAQAQRMAFKFASSPLDGETDNTFSLSIVAAWFKKSRMVVRGAAK